MLTLDVQIDMARSKSGTSNAEISLPHSRIGSDRKHQATRKNALMLSRPLQFSALVLRADANRLLLVAQDHSLLWRRLSQLKVMKVVRSLNRLLRACGTAKLPASTFAVEKLIHQKILGQLYEKMSNIVEFGHSGHFTITRYGAANVGANACQHLVMAKSSTST